MAAVLVLGLTVATVPESHEVRRWRWRLEDEAFDRRDAMLSRIQRVLLAVAVLAVAVLAGLVLALA